MEDEQEILVFPREALTTRERFVSWDVAHSVIRSVEESMTWLPREEAEKSEDFLQPIPCAIVRGGDDKYCVLRRVNEGRSDLRSRISLIVGGHVDKCPNDYGLLSLLSMTLEREIEEELGVNNLSDIEPVGLVIDHSSVVASRHIGFVYEIVVADQFKPKAAEEFSLRSKVNGQLYTANELSGFLKEFDPWSLIIFADYIAPSYSLAIGSQQEFPLTLDD